MWYVVSVGCDAEMKTEELALVMNDDGGVTKAKRKTWFGVAAVPPERQIEGRAVKVGIGLPAGSGSVGKANFCLILTINVEVLRWASDQNRSC